MDDSWNLLANSHFEGIATMEEWVLVKGPETSDDDSSQEDSFQGITLMAAKKHGEVVYMSTRKSPDAVRCSMLPSLECFKDSLLVLDLHKSKYLQTLDGSIGNLICLNRLILTSCSSLKCLPDSIRNLSNLTEVRFFPSNTNGLPFLRSHAL